MAATLARRRRPHRDRPDSRLSHEHAGVLYSHAHDVRHVSRSPEPAGTPAARCCACCSAHPEVEIGALTGGSNAGRAARRPAAAPGAAGRPGARGDHASRRSAGHDVVFLALPHGQSGAVAAAAGRRRRGHRLRRRLPAHRPARSGSSSTAATHAGTWPYGLPELPGQRALLTRRPPDRRPRLLPDRLHPGPGPGGRRRPGRAATSSWSPPRGTSGAGKAAEAAPARQRGDGQRQRVRRRRRAPAHPRDRPEPLRRSTDGDGAGQLHARCWCRCRAASWPPARRRCADGVTADDVRARLRQGVRRRAVRAPAAPRGSGRRPSR